MHGLLPDEEQRTLSVVMWNATTFSSAIFSQRQGSGVVVASRSVEEQRRHPVHSALDKCRFHCERTGASRARVYLGMIAPSPFTALYIHSHVFSRRRSIDGVVCSTRATHLHGGPTDILRSETKVEQNSRSLPKPNDGDRGVETSSSSRRRKCR